MPKADDEHTPSRRALLTSVAAVAGALTATLMPSAANASVSATLAGAPVRLDAVLIRLCARFLEIERAINAYPADIDERSPPHILAMLYEHEGIMRTIPHMRARSIDGCRAKAAALDVYLPRGRVDEDWCSPDRLARSLVNDLLGCGEQDGMVPP